MLVITVLGVIILISALIGVEMGDGDISDNIHESDGIGDKCNGLIRAIWSWY